MAPLISCTGVHLVTPQGTVTSKYASAIRYQETYLPLLKYLRKTHGWTTHTSDQINWPAHSSSLKKRLQHHKSYYVKMVQGILATNHRVHRLDPVRRGCPVCSCRDETWSHMARCPHQSRTKCWRAQLYQEVRNGGTKWQTKPELVELLVHGIRGWLEWNDDTVQF